VEDGRKSLLPCPVCGQLMLRPWLAGDFPDWDCYSCGLTLRGYPVVSGETLLRLAASEPDPRAFLSKITACE
jgi:hypothetical protein